jgi:hypothetical protein
MVKRKEIEYSMLGRTSIKQRRKKEVLRYKMKYANRKQFEAREVYKSRKLKSQLAPTGYEAFRVSPRTTTIFGKKYRKIYGAVVEPDYSRVFKKNKYGNGRIFGAKVTWFPHYYTTAKVKGGTRLLQPLRSYPVDYKEAKYKLMLK